MDSTAVICGHGGRCDWSVIIGDVAAVTSTTRLLLEVTPRVCHLPAVEDDENYVSVEEIMDTAVVRVQ